MADSGSVSAPDDADMSLFVLPQHMMTGKRKCVFHPPGSLVLLGVDHGVLDGLIHQSVHVGCEGVDGRGQSLAAL